MLRSVLLLLVCLFLSPLEAAEPVNEEPPKAVKDALATFDRTNEDAAKRAAARARAALELEIKRRTQAGDLDTALAAKNALQSINARMDKFVSLSSQQGSPVGKWQTQDGMVLVIETGGKGLVSRGSERPAPLEWKLDAGRYVMTFPTLDRASIAVASIWSEKDGSWSYASTDGRTSGSLQKLP